MAEEGLALLIAESIRAEEIMLERAQRRAAANRAAFEMYEHPERYATGTRDLKSRRYYEVALAGAMRDIEYHRRRIERLRAEERGERP